MLRSRSASIDATRENLTKVEKKATRNPDYEQYFQCKNIIPLLYLRKAATHEKNIDDEKQKEIACARQREKEKNDQNKISIRKGSRND